MKRLPLLLISALLALTAACGNDGDASSGGSGGHNDADVTFAQGMIAHHEQAVEMARMAPKKSKNTQVTDLASRIVAAQGPEIDKMKGWLENWDKPVKAGGGHNMSGMGGASGGGMMTDSDMAMLDKAEGPAFDKQFLTMMIEHHKGAIVSADLELKQGKFADAQALARDIIAAQQKEITEMEGLLRSA